MTVGFPAWAGGNEDDDFRLEVVFLDEQETPVSTQHVSLQEVRALPAAEFRTSTIWTEGLQTFRGVWLSDLIAYLKITEGNLDFSALNEYLIEIPMEDIVPGGPLVAYEWNGKRMSARDKGPLWVVFPYDADAKFQTETVYAQSIWQLDRIEVYR
jgi:hypothetical protein